MKLVPNVNGEILWTPWAWYTMTSQISSSQWDRVRQLSVCDFIRHRCQELLTSVRRGYFQSFSLWKRTRVNPDWVFIVTYRSLFEISSICHNIAAREINFAILPIIPDYWRYVKNLIMSVRYYPVEDRNNLLTYIRWHCNIKIRCLVNTGVSY